MLKDFFEVFSKYQTINHLKTLKKQMSFNMGLDDRKLI
jgi:hypothetical protein